MNVLKFPLPRICLAFASGIASAALLPPTFFKYITLSILVGIISCLAFHKWAGSKSLYFGIVLTATVYTCGIYCMLSHDESRSPHHFLRKLGSGEQVSGLQLRLLEKLKTTKKYKRAICEIEAIDGKNCNGKVVLNLATIQSLPAIGSRFCIVSALVRNRQPANPGAFDYGRYLSQRNIFGQLYYKRTIRPFGCEKNLSYYSDKLRVRIVRNISTSGFRQTELNVFAALMLGQQQEIDPEIVRDYQFAGAVHILSVSGLHVGFLLLFLNLLLKYLPETAHWRMLKLVITIGVLWGFALVAGFSPSIVRSVTMFSFVAIGIHLRRSTNIYHTLLVSILLILIVCPGFLFDIGFQLSYAALFFIVWLQPVFISFWKPQNKMIRYFWNILTVSFAAQIGTLPLSLYYFHQFPGLFFVTNLIVIPMLGVIMTAGLVCLILAVMVPIPFWLAHLTQESIAILDWIIAKVASVKTLVFQDIPFNIAMLLFLYLAAIAFFKWLQKPRFAMLSMYLVFFCLFQAAFVWPIWRQRNYAELLVFHSRGNTVLADKRGRNVALIPSKRISDKTMDFVVRPYLTNSSGRLYGVGKFANLVIAGNKKILIVDSSGLFPKRCRPDVVVLTNNAKFNAERMLKTLHPGIVIADGSNFNQNVIRWKVTCKKENIPFHATAEKGYYGSGNSR